MTTSAVRVRFAPSPTGHLHIGNARTALFNWLFARHHQGTFILRIEDTDIERSTVESDRLILEDMAWMGLDYDEGPDAGGDYGPYRQSERLDIYREHAQRLLEEGKAFQCFCTEEELAENRQRLLDAGEMPKYSGRCRNLTPEQREQFRAEGRVPTIRFHVEPGHAVLNNDLVRGEVVIERDMIGDFVLLRSNGLPSYNFAVVVDDALMHVTHVIRGEDHLTNTARQILLYDAFGFPKPRFGHLSMILGPDHSRLSKRHGATSVSQYRDMGYLPDALINYLVLLGWSSESQEEMLPREQLIKEFDIDRVSKSAAVFDVDKLNWMGGHYIRESPVDQVVAMARSFYQQAGYVSDTPSDDEMARLALIVEATRKYVSHLSELIEHSRIFFDADFDYEAEADTLLTQPVARAVIEALRDVIAELDEITAENCGQIFKDVRKASKVKGKDLYMSIRVAVTGAVHGPDLDKVLRILGKEAALQRIERTLQRVSAW